MTRTLQPAPTRAELYHRVRAASSLVLVLCVLAVAPRARGHPAPAEAPQFQTADCITTIDVAAQGALALRYVVAYDDRELMAGDIALPDAKTHQFFAFRGALFASGFNYALQAFAPAGAAPIELPLWITADDVKRAAQASGSTDATSFSEADVPQDAVLDQHPALSGHWLRITDDAARLPITVGQSDRPVVWDLAGVPPGVYTIAAYIFSPPYNGWAVRPGLVQVIASAQTDAGADAMPAMVVDPVQAVVFGYQGRRVRACVRAGEGARVHGYYRSEDTDEDWQPWQTADESAGESLELCFRSPRPELSGSLRLRFDLETADGTTQSFYSPDTLTALSGSGVCTPSDTICCDGAAPAAVDPCADGGGAACTADSAAQPGAISQDAGTAPADAAGNGAPPSETCALVIAPRSARLPLTALLLLLVALRRRLHASSSRP